VEDASPHYGSVEVTIVEQLIGSLGSGNWGVCAVAFDEELCGTPDVGTDITDMRGLVPPLYGTSDARVLLRRTSRSLRDLHHRVEELAV
jgi:hypothetical protein